MTAAEFYEVIYDWVDLVLNTTLLRGIEIRQAFQDIAIPEGNSISIPKIGDSTSLGHIMKSPYDESEGSITFSAEYEAPLLLREIRGDGNNLRDLIKTQEFQIVKDHFVSNNVAIRRVGTVVQVPSSTDTGFEQEWTLEIVFAFVDEISESISNIETVELINNIGE